MSLCGILLKGFTPSGDTSLATPTLLVRDNADGTVTATISGSTAGTTNTLYSQAIDGQLGGSNWTAAGDRSGDGSITVAAATGYYWWYVGSLLPPDGVVSNLVYQNVAASSDSVHLQCLKGVQAVIQSLALAGVVNSSVVIKKLALDRILGSLKQGRLGVVLPCVLLLPEAEEQDSAKGLNALDDIVYPVLALLVLPDNQEPTLAANLPTNLQWRQKLNRAFRQQRLTGASTIVDATVTPRIIADPQDWAAGFYVTALSFRFLSREPRGFNA